MTAAQGGAMTEAEREALLVLMRWAIGLEEDAAKNMGLPEAPTAEKLKALRARMEAEAAEVRQ